MKFCVLALALTCSLFGFEEQKVHKPIRVYADVVGDLFHRGHVEFFQKAKEHGDYLIIGVLSDETVKSYKREPILTLEERVSVIAACRYVDEVIVDAPLGVNDQLLDEYEIDIVVHGDDFDAAVLQEQYQAALDRNMMRIVPYAKGISTTDIIDRILYMNEHEPLSLYKKGSPAYEKEKLAE